MKVITLEARGLLLGKALCLAVASFHSLGIRGTCHSCHEPTESPPKGSHLSKRSSLYLVSSPGTDEAAPLLADLESA